MGIEDSFLLPLSLIKELTFIAHILALEDLLEKVTTSSNRKNKSSSVGKERAHPEGIFPCVMMRLLSPMGRDSKMVRSWLWTSVMEHAAVLGPLVSGQDWTGGPRASLLHCGPREGFAPNYEFSWLYLPFRDTPINRCVSLTPPVILSWWSCCHCPPLLKRKNMPSHIFQQDPIGSQTIYPASEKPVSSLLKSHSLQNCQSNRLLHLVKY